ncbi:NDP-sugar pyrophosphorylase family protein [Bacillus mesophilus]|uniref:NDP-sugar synthase n=1 Tax=Bacillus mesophilus TaxID=1808955 RepID=A0A6M0Q5R7_9BACI|nr:NDP-sugar synthase [Bacillus mesophilus]MBM7660840.1 NDP-sugar pyrophosphorylase family protein [Bacillus mesophilus]NEY71613.1 NDP-sugar synthase [Bacillus mesophilus]
MKAVILAGGEGKRMRPLTSTIPKPMLPFFQKPVLEYIIKYLRNQAITEIMIITNNSCPSIQKYFQRGEQWGVSLQYIYEDKPMGTAGCLKSLEAFIYDDKPLFVINGDIITDVKISEAIAFHEKNKSLLTILATKVKNPKPFGIIDCEENGRVRRYLEKPSIGEIYSCLVNMGMYIIQPELLQFITNKYECDMSHDLVPLLLSMNQPVYCFEGIGYWADIGSVSQYKQSHFDVLVGAVNVKLPISEVLPGIIIGKNVVIEEGATIKSPVFIGDRTIIKTGSLIGKNTIIGSDCIVTESVTIDHSIVWENVYIGPSCEVSNSIIANDSIITKKVKIRRESVIGENCEINREIAPEMLVKPYSKLTN